MQTWVRALVANALALTCLQAPSASAQELIPFRVGISDAVNTVLPVWMAQEGGFYAANGLKVEIVNMGGGSRGAKELQAGKIKATAINEPTTSQAREEGFPILIDLAAEKIPWLFSGVVVRRADLTDRRHLAVRFLRAVIEGNYLALSDAARAKAVLTRELKINNQTIIDISYEDFRAQSPPDMLISMPGVENVLKISAGDGSRNPDDYVDGAVLMELRKSGFFEAMQKKYRKL